MRDLVQNSVRQEIHTDNRGKLSQDKCKSFKMQMAGELVLAIDLATGHVQMGWVGIFFIILRDPPLDHSYCNLTAPGSAWSCSQLYTGFQEERAMSILSCHPGASRAT